MSSLRAGMCYCTLCDRYFPTEDARAQHVQHAPIHPQCVQCDRRFANKNGLRTHWLYSPRHHYCTSCDQHFRTAGGLRIHLDYASVHRDDSDDDSDDVNEIDEAPGWEDELGSRLDVEDSERADDDFEVTDAEANQEGHQEENEYWDDDDWVFEDDDEEEDVYDGYAPVPGPMRRDSDMLSSETVRGPSTTDFSSSRSACNDHDKQEQSFAGVLFNCPLCLEPPSRSSATRCGHLFCTSCINQALATKLSCPVCRQPALPRQLRKIYLSAN